MARSGRRRGGGLRRVVWILGIALAVLLAVRLVLPYAIERYAERVIDATGTYDGRVADVDLSLIRGAYHIEGVELRKRDGTAGVSFASVEAIDLALDWGGLLRGRLEGELRIERPVLNVTQEQTGTEVDWRERVQALLPIDLGRVEVVDGELHYRDPDADPPVDVALRSLDLVARDLTNRPDASAERPAEIAVDAVAFETGRLRANARFDPFAERPDLTLDLRLEGVDLTALDDFFRAYGGVDVEAGRFDLYVEARAREGRFDGYVKPLLRDVDVLRAAQEQAEQGPFATAWEAFVGGVAELVRNQPEEQIGTRIPLSGRFEDPDIGVWGALVELLRNAYVEALQPQLERELGVGE